MGWPVPDGVPGLGGPDDECAARGEFVNAGLEASAGSAVDVAAWGWAGGARMIGLVFLAVLAVYLTVFVLVVRATVRWARRTGRVPWKWGVGAGLAMYLPIFWDHIPTLIGHEILCRTVPSVTIYKTAAQWSKEHKDEPKPRKVNSKDWFSKDDQGNSVFRNTDRFETRIERTRFPPLPLRIATEIFFDTKTNEKLAERSMVDAGYGNFTVSGKNQAWKGWMHFEICAIRDGSWPIALREYETLAE